MTDQPKPPLTTTTSIWPAAAVLGVAVATLTIFMLINLIADKGVTATSTTVPIVVGGLATAPSNAVLDYCRHTSEIPSNIIGAFVVPINTTSEVGANIPNAGAGEFDCYQPLATTVVTSGSLLKFFEDHLGVQGWHLFSRGSSNGSPQSLFQKAGNDNFYWVVGVTVTTTRTNAIYWTYRIYQNSQTI